MHRDLQSALANFGLKSRTRKYLSIRQRACAPIRIFESFYAANPNGSPAKLISVKRVRNRERQTRHLPETEFLDCSAMASQTEISRRF
jgi:hypothetical protein